MRAHTSNWMRNRYDLVLSRSAPCLIRDGIFFAFMDEEIEKYNIHSSSHDWAMRHQSAVQAINMGPVITFQSRYNRMS